MKKCQSRITRFRCESCRDEHSRQRERNAQSRGEKKRVCATFQMAWGLEGLARGDKGMKREQTGRQVNSEPGIRRDSATVPTIPRVLHVYCVQQKTRGFLVFIGGLCRPSVSGCKQRKPQLLVFARTD